VAADRLWRRPSAAAFRVGDDLLHGRPRKPDLLCDRCGPDARLQGSEDQPFLLLAAVKNGAYLLVRNGRFGGLAQIGG